jgi:hypothetical protein
MAMLDRFQTEFAPRKEATDVAVGEENVKPNPQQLSLFRRQPLPSQPFALEPSPDAIRLCTSCGRQLAINAVAPEDDDEILDRVQFGELPPGVCPACMGPSPGIAIDGATIIHCNLCGDSGKVTPEQAEKYWKGVEEREGKREGNGN